MRPEVKMDGPWRIELLGRLRASRGDRVVTHFRSQKAAALLAYLAHYRERVHAREELVELLWPERPPQLGRRNLRVELSWLRHQLEPAGIPAGSVLLADRAFVQLNPTAVMTDVARFQAILAEATEGASAEQARGLAAAVELYRGELLPGYSQDWVLAERRRLEELFLQALRQLTALSEQTGDLTQARDWATQMVKADPLWEEGQYELIRLLAAAGQARAALRQYHELERVLEQQLGAVPGLKSRALAWQIQDQLSRSEDPESELTEPRQAIPQASLLTQPALAELPSGTVTFLYTDIEASTERWERVGPAFLEALASHHTLLRQFFRQHGGHEVKDLGEGYLVAFRDPGTALTCAVEAQQALAAHAWPAVVGPLRVRMALHTAFDAQPVGGDYRLIELHHGERMVKAGHGGQILCSERTARLLLPGLKEEIRLVGLGLYRLRSVAQPAELFQVDYPEMVERVFPPLRTPRPVQGSLPPPFTLFIGREPEIVQLCEAIGARLSSTGGRLLFTDSRRPGIRGAGDADGPRLITLTGPGGTGKTRLAQEVARRLWDSFNGAVWFVSLADLTDPQFIADRILEALRLPRSATVAPLDQVIAALSEQPSLLLLDNYEHLVADGAALVRTLPERVDGLTVLVTSRQRLRLAGEWEFRVPPLPTPAGSDSPEQLEQWASVSLFRDRAQAVDPGFQVTEANAEAVAALCARLEGLPLALELAAARARVLTPAQMLAQLEHCLDFLVSRERAVDPRQRSMRATYEWSYQLLPPEVQRFFARLSVFRAGCTLAAAAAVCDDFGFGISDFGLGAGPDEIEGRASDPPSIPNPESPIQNERALEYLTELLENSLIVSESLDVKRRLPTRAGDGHSQIKGALSQDAIEIGAPLPESACGASHHEVPEEKRFRMQEIVREYAAEKLSPKEQAITRQRHATYFLALAERAEPELVREAQVEWLDRLQWDHENLRGALDWAVTSAARNGEGALPTPGSDPGELGLRLAGALPRFWDQRDYRREDYTRLRRLVTLKETQARTAARAKALQALGNLATWLSNYREARSLLAECLSIRRELGDRGPLASALYGVGQIAFFQGDYQSARALLKEGLTITRELKDEPGIGNALFHLGRIARTQGEIEAARSLYNEALAIRNQLGDRHGIAACLDHLGHLAQEQGDLQQARSLHERSLAIKEELGASLASPSTLAALGQLCYLQGDLEAARGYFEKSRTGWQELDNRAAVAWALNSLGLIADRQDRYEEARWLLEQSLALRRELGDRWGVGVSLNSLGEAARHQGDRCRAVELFRESLAVFRSEGIKLGMVQCLENMGRAAAESLTGGWRPGEGAEEQADASAEDAASCRTRAAAAAARLFGAAAAVRDTLGTPLPPVDRADHDRSAAALCAALGEDAFEVARAEGRAMDLEQAAAYALQVGR